MSRKTVAILCGVVFILSTLFFWQRMDGTKPSSLNLGLGEEQLGKLCVSQAFPTITRGSERTKEETEQPAAQEQTVEQVKKQTEAAQTAEKEPVKKEKKKKKVKKADNKNPSVIIYHTHSTESYEPYTEDNFHTEKERGSVREVGEIMTAELNDLGIGVVHDKTIHDRPSYNQSYDRSLETILALRKKYPSAKYIIDLHRDAAAYAGNVGKTTKINNETVAKFSLVVGQNNANFNELMSHAKKISDKAESMYSGFGGKIIEKTYRYNEYVADKYLLLEIGNNKNNIKEVDRTAKYFAHVLAKVIEDEK